MFFASLEKFLFFDIETAGGEASFNELSERMSHLWSTRADLLRNHLSAKYPDNAGKTDEELYLNKAGLQAEFGRIVCISFGIIKVVDGFPKINVVSYAGEDERMIIEKSFKLITHIGKDSQSKLVGHNIKRFDIPYLCKRAYILGIPVPYMLQTYDKKPWEMPFVDTCEVWSFGAWQEGFASLDLISGVLGIDSPKDDIKGDQVHTVFYEDGDITRIQTYCQKDVVALIRILMQLSGLNRIEDSDIIYK